MLNTSALATGKCEGANANAQGGGGGKPWGLSAAPKGGGESPGD